MTMQQDVTAIPQETDLLPPDAPPAHDAMTPAATETRVAVASQWQLMRWRFKKHKLAVISMWIIAFFCIVGVFSEFLAPADPDKDAELYKYVRPQGISFFDQAHHFHAIPGVYGLTGSRNPETLRLSDVPDKTQWYQFGFFTHGDPYKFWGVWPTDVHLFGLKNAPADAPLFLLGTDRLGRDMLSRIIYGTRVSLSIGLISVIVSLILGVVLGGISGYYGGRVDSVVQRVIEFLRSLPQIPIWLALGAAFPPGWSILRVYFAFTLVFAMIEWTGLARAVRGRFLALREEDFVMAARFCGASERRIIFRHMVPSFLSHIIATLSLSIPRIILFETTLSFLGLGLRAPAISWGVLLQEAQNVQTVALSPWLLLPALAVVTTILAFNFMGDGLRDAADPYGR
jgi:peptide/nickel transport system permease protein